MLPFRGWMFPDVPQTARLHYVRGVAELPKSGDAAVALDGDDEFGGTGYLFRKAHLSSVRLRHRVLAYGAGVAGWRRMLALDVAIPAAGTQELAGVGGLAPESTGLDGAGLDASILGGTRPLYLRDLTFYGTASAITLQQDGKEVVRSIGSQYPVQIPSLAARNGETVFVNANGGAPVTARAIAEQDDPAARDHVTIDLATIAVHDDGNVVGSDYGKLKPGWADLRTPQLLEIGERPELRPVAGVNGLSDLEESQALGAVVEQSAAGIMPKGAQVIVEMAIAVWPEG